ncbi:MAG: hypothetical protein RQ866_04265, partial [Bacteroidales bacterium]|nr:hypothetical protein [Bacteroidales bacterium]
MRVIQNKKIRDLENKGEKIFRHMLLTVLSLLIAAPVFIIIYRYVPDIVIDINKESIRLDHILTGIIVFALIRFMVGLIEKFIVLVALGFFLLLSIAHFS